jgi:hypothetical protein
MIELARRASSRVEYGAKRLPFVCIACKVLLAADTSEADEYGMG